MASVEVLRAQASGAEHSTAHLNQLLHNMRISPGDAARARAARPMGPPQPAAPPPQPALAAAAPPAALALAAPVHAAHATAQPPAPPAALAPGSFDTAARAAVRERAAAFGSPPPPPTAAAPGARRARSPDSRYVTTNWAAHDEVDEELSFMMADHAAISNGGACPSLSYIA